MSWLIYGFVVPVWPNLAANVIWIPVAAVAARRHKRQVDQMHRDHQETVRQIVEDRKEMTP